MFFEKLKKYKILLASGSKRRHELLKGLEINFEIISFRGEFKRSPEQMDKYISFLKA